MSIPGYDRWKLRSDRDDLADDGSWPKCRECDGFGIVGPEDDERICPECRGTGLTEQYLGILQYLHGTKP